MKIRLLSDLHTEGYTGVDPIGMQYKDEDVLILAGDIAVGPNKVASILGKFIAAGWPYIVYVAGNHEYYRGQIDVFNRDLNDRIVEANSQFTHQRIFNLTEGDSAIINDVTFVGASLWTNFRDSLAIQGAAGHYINDFTYIRNFTTNDARDLYEEHLDYLLDVTSAVNEFNPTTKMVVVTHFLPADECVDPQYRGGETDVLNGYFANDLGEWIKTLKNTTWCFGHTHSSVDITLGTTRLLANPMGYNRRGTLENKNYDPFFTFEV